MDLSCPQTIQSEISQKCRETIPLVQVRGRHLRGAGGPSPPKEIEKKKKRKKKKKKEKKEKERTKESREL